jgi:hypothetical protein
VRLTGYKLRGFIVFTMIRPPLVLALGLAGLCVYQTLEVWRLEEELALAKRRGAPVSEKSSSEGVSQAAMVSAPALSAESAPIVGMNRQTAVKVVEQPKVKRTGDAEAQGESAFIGSIMTMAKRAADLDREFRKVPGREIPELELLSESDWLKVAGEAGELETPEQMDAAMSQLRRMAKQRFVDDVTGVLQGLGVQSMQVMQSGDLRSLLNSGVKDVDGRPFLSNVSDAVLSRYEIVPRGMAASEWSRSTQGATEPVPDLFIREKGAPGPDGQVVIGAYLKDGVFRKTMTLRQAVTPSVP